MMSVSYLAIYTLYHVYGWDCPLTCITYMHLHIVNQGNYLREIAEAYQIEKEINASLKPFKINYLQNLDGKHYQIKMTVFFDPVGVICEGPYTGAN